MDVHEPNTADTNQAAWGGAAVHLAWSSLTHNKRRLMASVCGVGFAVILMFVEAGFLNGLYDTQTESVRKMNADLLVVNRYKQAVVPKHPFPKARLAQARRFAGVAAAYPLYLTEYKGFWKNSTDGRSHPILVYGFHPDDPVFRIPGVLENASRLKRADTALMDSRSKKHFQFRGAGTTAELNYRTVTVVGTYELGADYRSDGNVMVSDSTFFKCFTTRTQREVSRVEFGLLTVAADQDPLEVRDRLRQELAPDVSVLTKDEFIDRVKAYWDAKAVGYVFTLGVVVGFLIGVVNCYQILFTSIVDRLPQFATLKAIGYSNHYLVKVVLQEALYLSLLGFVGGLLASLVIFAGLEWYSGILMRLTLPRIIVILVLTVVMCGLAGCIAVRKALRSDPAELF